MSGTWTIAQAAAIIEKPSQLLKKAVEHAPVKPALARRGKKQVYMFEMRDLVFFCALDDMKTGLTSKKQVEIYNVLRNMPSQDAIGSVELGPLKYDFRPFAHKVKKNIEAAEKLSKLIDMTEDGPIIKGTDVNAYRIAALRDGMTVGEILDDYPSLSEQQVHAANAYAERHPKAGRPYPTVTAKHAIRMAGADATDFLPSRE